MTTEKSEGREFDPHPGHVFFVKTNTFAPKYTPPFVERDRTLNSQVLDERIDFAACQII